MKKIISMMVALLCATTIDAQVQSDIRTATLIHGEQTSVFYGAGAFAEAYNASADGDVIVLSSGDFNNAADITKSVSIYGAGFETDPVSGGEPTTIAGINVGSKETYDEMGNKVVIFPTVHLEGLFLNGSSGFRGLYIGRSSAILENLLVRKCKMYRYVCDSSTKNCRLSQSVFTGGLGCYYDENGYRGECYAFYNTNQQGLIIENCWIGSAALGSLSSTINYDHCIINWIGAGQYAHFTNNIIKKELSGYCTAHHNIFTTSSIGSNVTGEGNWTNVSIDGIFTDAEQGANYTATNDFTLRFPAKYVGTDGTEVGINGGVAPFNRISPIPRILSSDIDLRTTAEGKLNVSIQVEAQTNE